MTLTPSPLPNLRPLSLAELLDQAIRLYRRNFLTLIAIVAIVYVPLALVEIAITAYTTPTMMTFLQNPRLDPSQPFGFPLGYWVNVGGNLVLGLFNLVLLSGVGTAAVTRAVTDNYLGQPIGIGRAYRNIAGRWGKLVQVLLFSLVVSLALSFWTLVPCVGWISGPGLLVFYSMVMTPLFAAIVVLEGKGARATIRRAWDLGRRRFWWLLGFMLILSLFALLVVSGPTTLATFIVQAVVDNVLPASDPAAAYLLQTLVTQTVGVVFRLIYLPLALVCYTLLYFDLCIRTEGLDLTLQWATRQLPAGTEAPTLTQLLAQAPAPETSGWLTGNEFVSLLGLTLGGVFLYVALVAVLFFIGLAQFAL